MRGTLSHRLPAILLAAMPLASAASTATEADTARRPNIVFVLADDHRHDALGCAGHPFLETPHLDRLAREGVRFERAVVTTSLCSPSRASILTGLYAHRHGVVDNYHPVRDDLVFFPELLQSAGYETAFVGKWHMGDTDAPQRGFDHWVSFRGQGEYFPDGRGTTRVVPQASREGLNVDGERVPQKGYITDEITDYAVDWLTGRGQMKGEKNAEPFFLYLSHKAVHSDFVAADRHRGRYAQAAFPLAEPPSIESLAAAERPRWLLDQRNSRHGVGFAYNLPRFDLAAYYRRYCETLLAVDESLGRLLAALEAAGQLDDTLVAYMGDNGFQFGEHGLIDKRTAYAASIRVPLLMRWPKGNVAGGRVATETVANIDIAPTLLEAAGIDPSVTFDGRSVLPLVRGTEPEAAWREALLYEYFWERNYPQTPTMHAVLAGRWKYIRYHGIWDTDELFDLEADPDESTNLIARPEHQEMVAALHKKLFDLLSETKGEALPLLPDRGASFPWRRPDGPSPGGMPERFQSPKEPAEAPVWAQGIEANP